MRVRFVFAVLNRNIAHINTLKKKIYILNIPLLACGGRCCVQLPRETMRQNNERRSSDLLAAVGMTCKSFCIFPPPFSNCILVVFPAGTDQSRLRSCLPATRQTCTTPSTPPPKTDRGPEPRSPFSDDLAILQAPPPPPTPPTHWQQFLHKENLRTTVTL